MQPATALLAVLRTRWSRTGYPLQLASIAFPALLFCGLAWIDYQFELQRTRTEVTTTTRALAEQAQAVVEAINLVIARVLDHLGDQDWQALSASPETHDFLAHLRDEVPQVEAVFLADPHGIIAASSRAYPMPRYDVHLAEYFAAAQDGDALVLTPPMLATMSGTKGFIISRRRARDGKFDGMVGVTVSKQYFESFYRTILTHPTDSAAALIRTDGTLLVRFPDPPVYASAIPASNPILVAARDGDDIGLLAGRSVMSGTERIAGFRRLRGLPILVGYSINRSVFLATWATHAAILAACAILLSTVFLATERVVRRKTALEHGALRRLVEETERRRQAEAMAQQSQKMEALGRLTGGVAHDFNNLLAVILGSLELALRRDRDPRSIRLLKTATEAAQRGAKLTAQMLAFSRKREVAVRPVDVNAVIMGMDDLLRRTLGPGVRLNYALDAGLWPVLADVVQLELALLNLAVNARDAMPNGGELTFRSMIAAASGQAAAVDSGPELQPGDYVCVQVADTGIGMSEEVRARAHEPFYTTKGPGSGTGLGLSMVYGFVRELGGAVTVDSTPCLGTTITLFLRRAERSPVVEPRGADADPKSARPGRILLIDDDDGVRQATREMLEELGHTVIDVASGAAALDLLEHDRHFDVLLVDFAMPLMNGGQFASAATSRWPAAPILFATGYVENDALRPWSDRGYRTVQKPYTTAELELAVEVIMRQAEAVTG